MGGSATTDGGYPCVKALEPHSRLHGVELTVACDVTTRFLDAAATFAPQKGATPAQVALLARRLERLAQVYEEDFGVDVRPLEAGVRRGASPEGWRLSARRWTPASSWWPKRWTCSVASGAPIWS
jgi:glycerate kinase